MNDELVTIAEFGTVFEAQIASDELNENDIKAMVVGDDLKMVSPMVGPSTVEVKVFEADAEKAKALLKAMQDRSDDTDDASEEL
jgi:hypothetical protein